MKICVLALLLGLQNTSFAQKNGLTLDQYLIQVKKNNRLLSAIDESLEASKNKKDAGDLSLAPVLTASYSLATDKSLPSSLADKREIKSLNLGLAQKFSTGTLVSLSAKTDEFENEKPANQAFAKYSTGGLGVTVQQSLWKDFLGEATGYRRERESSVNKVETMASELKKRAILIEAESAFWDYAVALEDLKIKKANLERARKIDSWTLNRVNNGINDRSDLMNVKALASVRELELQTAEDEVKSQTLRLRQNLDLAETDKTPDIEANMTEARPYITDLMNKKNIIKIESYLSYLESQVKKSVALEVQDALKPELNLVGSYKTSTFDSEYNETLQHLTKTDRPTTFVGVNFTWLFDTAAKKAQLQSAQKESLAASLTADKKMIEGKQAWMEQVRKYEVTKENVKILEKIAQYQRERAKAEQDKFSKGRTVTANVVTAETDAAEAEVRFLKAKAGLRKLEVSSLQYTNIPENFSKNEQEQL